VNDFSFLRNIIIGIRARRSELRISPKIDVSVRVIFSDKDAHDRAKEILDPYIVFIQKNCHVASFIFSDQEFEQSASVIFVGGHLSIDVSSLIDTDKEKARIAKELAEVEPYIKQLEAKLAGDFATNAPPEIVEKERQKLLEAKAKVEKLKIGV
jgi:valyl-tRNA synthetase